MSFYAQYVKECEGFDTIENGFGFISYGFPPEGVCYIREVWIDPNHRKLRHASVLVDQVAKIAKQRGVMTLTTTCGLNANGCEKAVLTILHYGFKIMGASNNTIYFSKELT